MTAAEAARLEQRLRRLGFHVRPGMFAPVRDLPARAAPASAVRTVAGIALRPGEELIDHQSRRITRNVNGRLEQRPLTRT